MEDFLQWFKGLRERLSDPFLFASTFTWAIFNWRFFAVLLLEGQPDDRSKVLDLAAEQLSWHWTPWRLLNRSFALVLAIGIGFAYARWYPVARGWFRVRRTRADANAARDAAKESDRAERELQSSRHAGELFTRDTWLDGPEIKELRGALKDAYAQLCPERKPSAGPAHYYRTTMGPVVGFGRLTNDGRILPLGAAPYAPGNLAYVFKLLPENGLAFAAAPGMAFPIPKPEEPRRHYEYLSVNGVEYSDHPGHNWVAHVRLLEDRRFAVFSNGSPTVES